MTHQIHPLRPNDFDSWVKMFQEYATFYKMQPPLESMKKTWSWLMDDQHVLQGFVAKDSTNNLIGFVHYRGMPSPLRGCDIGFIDDLFVTPKHRGAGIGKALIQAVKKEAHIKGWPLVRWITKQDNHPAQNLYNTVAQPTDWLLYEMD